MFIGQNNCYGSNRITHSLTMLPSCQVSHEAIFGVSFNSIKYVFLIHLMEKSSLGG